MLYVGMDVFLKCLDLLGKSKHYSPKWWLFDGDLPWYKVTTSPEKNILNKSTNEVLRVAIVCHVLLWGKLDSS